jgi:fatty acid desaturase
MIQPLRPWLGLRDRSDVLSLAVLLAGLACLGLGWAGLLPLWAWPAAPALVYLAYLINHNHLHLCLWRARRMHPANRVTGVLLSTVMGFPAAAVAPLHLANHHRANNGSDDFMCTGLMRGRPGWWALLTYPLAAVRRYRRFRAAAHAAYGQQHPAWRHEVREQRVAMAALVLAALICKPMATLGWLVLPWMLGQAWVINANFIQHHGCDPADPLGHCRCTTGWINRLIFNGGWHLAHHAHPGVHWSRLPQLGLRSRHAGRSLLLQLWRLAHARA